MKWVVTDDKIIISHDNVEDIIDRNSAIGRQILKYLVNGDIDKAKVLLTNLPNQSELLELPDDLRETILFMESNNMDTTFLRKFWDRLNKNPDKNVKQQLYTFLVREQIAIDKDGYVIGYKSVRRDYTAWRDETTKYEINTYVTLDRSKCDSNPNVSCSSGLHVGSLSYAKWFGGQNKRILIVRVDPKDVVSVPSFEADKCRVCKLYVMGELLDTNISNWLKNTKATQVLQNIDISKYSECKYVEKKFLPLDCIINGQQVYVTKDSKYIKIGNRCFKKGADLVYIPNELHGKNTYYKKEIFNKKPNLKLKKIKTPNYIAKILPEAEVWRVRHSKDILVKNDNYYALYSPLKETSKIKFPEYLTIKKNKYRLYKKYMDAIQLLHSKRGKLSKTKLPASLKAFDAFNKPVELEKDVMFFRIKNMPGYIALAYNDKELVIYVKTN